MLKRLYLAGLEQFIKKQQQQQQRTNNIYLTIYYILKRIKFNSVTCTCFWLSGNRQHADTHYTQIVKFTFFYYILASVLADYTKQTLTHRLLFLIQVNFIASASILKPTVS